MDETLDPLHIQNFAPYGSPFGSQGSVQSSFGFTGEPTAPNDLVQLPARYYSPVLGVFPSLDPLEGSLAEPLSLNSYAYDNPANRVDPIGLYSCSNEPGIISGVYQELDQALTRASNTGLRFPLISSSALFGRLNPEMLERGLR